MNDQDQFGARVAGFLDDGAAGLRPGVAYRLQGARARALAQLAPAEEAAPAGIYTLAGAGGGSLPQQRAGRPWSRGRWLLLGAMLVAALFFWQQSQAPNDIEELEDLDARILTSDLPIDAYLDRGFQQWLLNASHPQ